MGNGPFILTEQQVGLRLGVPSDWIRQRRGPKGDRWSREGTGPILWSEGGYAALAGELSAEKAQEGPQEPAGEKAAATTLPTSSEASGEAPSHAAGPEKDAVATLLVKRVGFVNRRVLHAVSAENPTQLMTVWVQNSTRFAVGLAILARQWPGRPGVWTFAGNPENPAAGAREPRRKGVW